LFSIIDGVEAYDAHIAVQFVTVILSTR